MPFSIDPMPASKSAWRPLAQRLASAAGAGVLVAALAVSQACAQTANLTNAANVTSGVNGANFLHDSTGGEGSESALFPEEPRFSLAGFGSLVASRSTAAYGELLYNVAQPRGISNRWSGRSDSALGAQAGYRINDTLEAVAQVVSHYRDDGSFRPDLTWAFLKLDLTPRLALRLGRVGTEFMMHADSRLIGYSYQPVRPPIEFYGAIPINYGDGVDARLRWPVGAGVVRVEGFVGVAREDLYRYEFKGAHIAKETLGYDVGPWQLRYIATQARFRSDIPGIGAFSDQLNIKDTLSTYHSLAAVYDDGSWLLQGAANSIRHEALFLRNTRAFYLLAGRRFGSLTPYVGYAQARSSAKHFELGSPDPLANANVAQAMLLSNLDSRTLTLGTRWDFRRNMDVKAQLDFVRTGPDSNLLLRDASPGGRFSATVFSLSLDFIF